MTEVNVAAIDPRIGVLMRRGRVVYYAYAHGYDRPPTEGSLKRVMACLGLRSRARSVQGARVFVVTVTPRWLTYGSHGENGSYTIEVTAPTRDVAIAKARQERRHEEGRYGLPAHYRACLKTTR